jgi:hypothetical protein
VYLAVVLDAFSRRVVGWSIADHIRSELVVDAVQMAIWRRRPPEGQTVAHSDHGSQYTSWAFGRRLRSAGLLGSMGSIGDCFDNSVAESFFGTLQLELLDEHRWATREQLALAIFDWIEVWYNPRRRHEHPPVGRTPRSRRKSMSSRKKSRVGRPSKFPPEFRRDAVATVLDDDDAVKTTGCRACSRRPGRPNVNWPRWSLTLDPVVVVMAPSTLGTFLRSFTFGHRRRGQVAETVYGTGQRKHRRDLRLVGRRTRLTERAQRRLWPDWPTTRSSPTSNRHHRCRPVPPRPRNSRARHPRPEGRRRARALPLREVLRQRRTPIGGSRLRIPARLVRA